MSTAIQTPAINMTPAEKRKWRADQLRKVRARMSKPYINPKRYKLS